MIWPTSEAVRPDKQRYSPAELKEIVIITRLSRHNRGLACGAEKIRQELKNLDIQPLPSLSFISRLLREGNLTYRRTGNY